MANPVDTNPFPLAGITVSFALYRSYPAAKADPRVGARADSVSFFTRSGGAGAEIEVTAVPLEEAMTEAMLVEVPFCAVSVLVRLARGDAGSDGGSWETAGAVAGSGGGGVACLVMIFGRGKCTREIFKSQWDETPIYVFLSLVED
jgi:hypothetical protein